MFNKNKLWPHQTKTYEFGKDKTQLVDASSAGCVDAETEYLTPTGWKFIKDYDPAFNETIAQFHPSTTKINFAKPLDYVKKQCSVMYHFNPARGLDMMLSAEHRVLHYPKGGIDPLLRWKVSSAEEFTEMVHYRCMAATFEAPNTPGINLSDEEIRVMVAVIADGYFSNKSDAKCTIRLKKERKKIRIRELLNAAGIEYVEKIYNERIKGFTVFIFYAPFRDKIFDAKYWKMSPNQLAVVADEALYWDGDQKSRFFTTKKPSADFIQYAMSSTGHVAALSTCVREETDRTRPIEYVVQKRPNKHPLVGGMRKESIKKVRPKDNHKYCFTTETSFWLARRNGRIFATGNTGKTIAHAAIAEGFLANGGSRLLVVSPKILVRSAWLEELEANFPDLTVSLAEAPADNRKEAFDSKSDVVLINVDGLKWLAGENPKWLKNRLGAKPMLIVDESHTLKNPTAQRTKAALKISPLFKKRHVMSGTMAPNSVVELWSQLKVVDDGARLGKRYTAFRNLMQTPVHKGMFVEWQDKPDSQQVVYGLISDITIRHSFEEVMKHVPDMQQHVVWYDLPKKHKDVYKQLEKDAFIAVKSKTITAVNAASLANKLLQCASGAVYNDPDREDRSWSIVDSGRYELITELVDSRPHSIVFFLWKHQKYELEKLLSAKKISYAVLDGDVKGDAKRQDIVTKFQNGEFRTLLMHPETGAYGLTLTKATSVIYASPVYEAKAKLQGDARIRRGVQDQATESIVVLAKGTRDIQAYEVFSGKKSRLDALNELFSSGV